MTYYDVNIMQSHCPMGFYHFLHLAFGLIFPSTAVTIFTSANLISLKFGDLYPVYASISSHKDVQKFVHYMLNGEVNDKHVDAANVGDGTGSLTNVLVESGANVLAIEKNSSNVALQMSHFGQAQMKAILDIIVMPVPACGNLVSEDLYMATLVNDRFGSTQRVKLIQEDFTRCHLRSHLSSYMGSVSSDSTPYAKVARTCVRPCVAYLSTSFVTSKPDAIIQHQMQLDSKRQDRICLDSTNWIVNCRIRQCQTMTEIGYMGLCGIGD
ncbi:Ribosomal RNA adenine methylase transferase [Artemisia annua]|uniref:Ribosomal RNA adenine methylase transferase n=1 Tax=Artemisia annua TaxID=35608 RepID=A0A2U1NGP2_ARTAN|nr:Ribosomal RNA adenine methylase transferase [Artemisia annua]